MKNKAVVTGGAGFIGSHLADALVERGFEVHIIDNLSTGKKEYVNKNAIFHKADIRNLDVISAIVKGAEFVFHLAALPRIQPSIKDPVTSHEINSRGTLNVLLAGRESKVKKVIYSASSSAYGLQERMPLQEDMAPNPGSPYAMDKYFGEVQGRVFSALYGLPMVSLRYFNVYGPRQSSEGAYATVVGIFLDQKKVNKHFTVVPDGKQRRDFTHVADVVRANILAMESNKVGKGEIINIGTGKNYNIFEVADMIGGPWKFIEPREGEARETLADNSKARELLGWEPEISFEKGIAELKKNYGLS